MIKLLGSANTLWGIGYRENFTDWIHLFNGA